MLVTSCEDSVDSSRAAPPTPVVEPVPAPQPGDYVEQMRASLAAQDSPGSYTWSPAPSHDVIAAMSAAMAAQDGAPLPASVPAQAVSAEASKAWSQTFRQQPANPRLTPLNRKQLEQLSKYHRMPVKDLPPELRPLASNCPELSKIAVKLIGEGANAVADGTRAELPVQLLVGVGEAVAEQKEEEICGFLIGRLQ